MKAIESVINFSKFSDRQVCADPDQTAPRGAVRSGSTLFAIPNASFGCITLKETPSCSTFRVITTIFWVSEYLGNLRYMRNYTVNLFAFVFILFSQISARRNSIL